MYVPDLSAARRSPYLPDIVASLKEMQGTLGGKLPSADERTRMAGGLGRVVTDDAEFSESNLGVAIIDLINVYADFRTPSVHSGHDT